MTADSRAGAHVSRPMGPGGSVTFAERVEPSRIEFDQVANQLSCFDRDGRRIAVVQPFVLPDYPRPPLNRCNKCNETLPAGGDIAHACPVDALARSLDRLHRLPVQPSPLVTYVHQPDEPLGFFGTTCSVLFGVLIAIGIENFVRWLA